MPAWWTAYQSPQLDALVEEALEHSPSLAAARSSLKAAREQLRSQIGQNVLPSVDAGVDAARQRALTIPNLPQETFLYNVFAADVQASYTFDFFGAALLADRALARQVQQQAFELESVRRALAANVVVATIDAASLERQLEALHLPAEIPVAVPSELLHQRPDILAAEAGLRSAADSAGAATASMFPSLTLSATYGRGGFDWSTFTSPAGAIWSAGALLTQPLFHGGALTARRRQYEASYEAAVNQYRQTVLAAFQNVADTLVALETDEETLALARRQAAALAALHQDLEARHAFGSASSFTALGAALQSENTNLQLIRAQAARLADTANLFQAMGQPAPVDQRAARATIRSTLGRVDGD